MRWSQRTVPALLVCAVMLVACGDQDASVPASAEPSATRDPVRTGTEQTVSPGLVVGVGFESVGGDGQQAWLNVMMSYDTRAGAELPLPSPTLRCAQSDNAGQARSADATIAGSGGRTVELQLPSAADGSPLRTCSAPVHVAIGSARWRLEPHEVEYLNEELARDLGRPYHWIATHGQFSSGYQVVFVPDMTADEALRILDPIRREPAEDDFDRVVLAEHERGVVLFTHAYVPDSYVRALSRGGLAASYGNTVNGDDHVLVASDGEVIRSFDPFLDHDYEKTKRLPQEKGLDLENDTGPASWTLLERITGIHVTQDWLESSHPAYLLED